MKSEILEILKKYQHEIRCPAVADCCNELVISDDQFDDIAQEIDNLIQCSKINRLGLIGSGVSHMQSSEALLHIIPDMPETSIIIKKTNIPLGQAEIKIPKLPLDNKVFELKPSLLLSDELQTDEFILPPTREERRKQKRKKK